MNMFGSQKQNSPEPLTELTLLNACEALAESDLHLSRIFAEYGVPPLWARQPGFPTLVHIILEQQVSLASAQACFDKLQAYLGDVMPERFLELSDEELRAIGFSRQKTNYVRGLANALVEKRLDLEALVQLSDAEVMDQLLSLKGIGHWTANIYLLMALLRPDVMPKGDIALHAAWHRVSGESRPTADEFIQLSQKWSPHRSTAARLLWHFYLSSRKDSTRK